MVRTYWFFPVFHEASGNLDLQPFARIDHVEACRPRAMYESILEPNRGARLDCPGTGRFKPDPKLGGSAQTVTRRLNSSRTSFGKPGTSSRSSTDE
jgi:hypothetical protein